MYFCRFEETKGNVINKTILKLNKVQRMHSIEDKNDIVDQYLNSSTPNQNFSGNIKCEYPD